MEYVRSVDFAAFDRDPGRVTQVIASLASCGVNCIKTPAGEGSPAGLHTHEVDQIFYVLSGRMGLEIAGKTCEVGPGSVAIFPAGVPHRNWNAGGEPTVHLAINTPLPDPAVPFAKTA